MRRPATISAKAWASILWALAGLFELPLIAILAGLQLPFTRAWDAVFHIIAALLVFFAPPRERGWLQPTRHWGEPFGLATLLVPVLGWLASGWILWLRWDATAQKEAYRFDDDAPEDSNPLAALGTPLAIRRELADALEVLPAADALLSQDPMLKRGAIETLSRIKTSESLGWILRARTDGDPETRFYATSALTSLKRDFETAIRAAERESVNHPGDAIVRLAVQRVRYEYAVSGMVDGSARHALLVECRERLTAAAERDSDAARLAYLVERALNPREAFPALERLGRLDPSRQVRWLRERVELLFELGRHREVSALIHANRSAALAGTEADVEWRAAVFWWSRD